MITQEELNEWKRLADAASAGPWIVEETYSGENWLVGSWYMGIDSNDGKYYHVTTDHVHGSQLSTAAKDAAFIAAAREAIPALIAEVERLTQHE